MASFRDIELVGQGLDSIRDSILKEKLIEQERNRRLLQDQLEKERLEWEKSPENPRNVLLSKQAEVLAPKDTSKVRVLLETENGEFEYNGPQTGLQPLIEKGAKISNKKSISLHLPGGFSYSGWVTPEQSSKFIETMNESLNNTGFKMVNLGTGPEGQDVWAVVTTGGYHAQLLNKPLSEKDQSLIDWRKNLLDIHQKQIGLQSGRLDLSKEAMAKKDEQLLEKRIAELDDDRREMKAKWASEFDPAKKSLFARQVIEINGQIADLEARLDGIRRAKKIVGPMPPETEQQPAAAPEPQKPAPAPQQPPAVQRPPNAQLPKEFKDNIPIFNSYDEAVAMGWKVPGQIVYVRREGRLYKIKFK